VGTVVVAVCRVKEAVAELPLNAAVTVTDWSVENEPVVALKLAEVEPAATVTEAGIVSVLLVSVSVTKAPPVEAALLSVTEQVLEPFGARVAGLQLSDDTSVDADRVMVAVAELPLYVAVTIALWLLETVVVVALKEAVVAPDATVIDAGTVKAALLSEIAIVPPPVGAALLSVTVQVLEALGPRVVGLQLSDDTSTDADRVIVAVAELPLYVAVTIALWLLETVVVVALKVAVIAPDATVIDAGTVKAALLSEIAIVPPPVGAALLSVTVQVLEALGPRVVGLQLSDDTSVDADRVIVAVAELPL
jgi:hypothetical protein